MSLQQGKENMNRVTLEELRDALDKTQGNLTNAAKILGVRRESIWLWGKREPKVKEIINNSKKQTLDQCVTAAKALALGIPIMENGKFVGWQEKPDGQMLRYFISTLGRDEGFGESIDVTSGGEKIGGVQVEIIDSRDKVMKKEEDSDDNNGLEDVDHDEPV